MLADAITAQKRLCIVADYDCDGATACAVACAACACWARGTPTIWYPIAWWTATAHGPHLAPRQRDRCHVDYRGQRYCQRGRRGRSQELGMSVVVTDHHLPGDQLPLADAIVQPQPARLRVREQIHGWCG
ncbi:hypothetical protein J4711_13500, partial [Staphylococcus epidermidis]|nr:hypothetical protein [Staphylococcus epidermidis]